MRGFRAIPTRYAGVEFRSRLEARWAAFFDEVAWAWDYEPLDFGGWTPDFLVDVPGYGPVPVEVKPATNEQALAFAAAKVHRSTFRGRAIALGAGPLAPTALGLAIEVDGSESPVWSRITTHSDLLPAWREAYNLTKWRPRVFPTVPLASSYRMPWFSIARSKRQAAGDDERVVGAWASLVDRTAAAAGDQTIIPALLAHAWHVHVSSDEQSATAFYIRRSIQRALLSEELAHHICDVVDDLGVGLDIVILPEIPEVRP